MLHRHTLPLLDFDLYANGNSQEKSKFVQQLGMAFEEIGFVAIKNHYLSEKVESVLYQETKNFFNLPREVKMKYCIENLAGQRGFTPFGVERAKDANQGDLKEFWHFGQYVPDEIKKDFTYPANIEVKEIPAFNEVGEKSFKLLEKTGKILLQAIAEYLRLDKHYFDKFVVNGNSILRPIFYAPITKDPQTAVRAGQHEDINLITLLMGASAQGLQILDKHNKWQAITTGKGEMVINVGDMLQRLTNNKMKSTTHRVVNPPKEKWGEPRYSIPFFLHPIANMPLNCLSNCMDADRQKKYDDITAGEYLIQRLKEIGLA